MLKIIEFKKTGKKNTPGKNITGLFYILCVTMKKFDT